VTLTAFLKALLYAVIGTTVIYLSGYACIELADALRNKKISSTKYYRAFRYNNKVYVGKLTISRATAVTRLKTGQDTYTWKKDNAKSIASSAGRGITHAEIGSLSKKKRGIYYESNYFIYRKSHCSVAGSLWS
jgi:hypothetical protein